MRVTINTKMFDDCTIGRLTVDCNDFQCFTLELPWLDNKPNVSCIPAGVYKVYKRFSPSKQCKVIEFLDVPGRTYIQMHIGNYTRQILGCILPGMQIKDFNSDGVPDVGSSEQAFNKLMEITPDRFEIEIIRT